MVLLQASMGIAIEHYAGIDVSLESSSVRVVDGPGQIIREVTRWLRNRRRWSAWFGGLGVGPARHPEGLLG